MREKIADRNKSCLDGHCFPQRSLQSPLTGSPLLFSFIILATFISTVMAQESRYREGYAKYPDFGVYKHVYPPFNLSQNIENCTPSENTTCPLFVAVMLSFGSIFNSSGALLGVQIALDQINDDPNILPGYRLHYAVMDSQVGGIYVVQ